MKSPLGYSPAAFRRWPRSLPQDIKSQAKGEIMAGLQTLPPFAGRTNKAL